MHKLGTALVKYGVIPENCTLMDVRIPVTGPVVMTVEKYLTVDELRQFAAVLTEFVDDKGVK